MRLTTTTAILLTAATIVATGCVPGKQRNRNAPAGRGSFNSTIIVPEADTRAVLAQRYGLSTAPALTQQAPAPQPPAALPPALLNKKVAVHLTQGAPALASGPRKDVVKGTIRGLDGDFLIVEAEAGGTLYLPRATVLAIEELP